MEAAYYVASSVALKRLGQINEACAIIFVPFCIFQFDREVSFLVWFL